MHSEQRVVIVVVGVILQILGVVVYSTGDAVGNFGGTVLGLAGMSMFIWGCTPANAWIWVRRSAKLFLVTVCVVSVIGAALLFVFRVGPFDDTITFTDAHAEAGVVFAEFSINFDRLPKVRSGWQRRVLIGLGREGERSGGFYYQLPPPDVPESGEEHCNVILPLVGPDPSMGPSPSLIVEVADIARNRNGGRIYDQAARRVLNLWVPESAFRILNDRTTKSINADTGETFNVGKWATVEVPPKTLVQNSEVLAHARSAKHVRMLKLIQLGGTGELLMHPGKSITVTLSYSDLGEWGDLQLLAKGWPCRSIDGVEIDEVARTVTFEIEAAKHQEYYLVRRSPIYQTLAPSNDAARESGAPTSSSHSQ